MEPWKLRFIDEYNDLKVRTEKLENMLKSYLADELNFTPICNYNILHEQFVYMKSYLDVLEQRAKIECIELKK